LFHLPYICVYLFLCLFLLFVKASCHFFTVAKRTRECRIASGKIGSENDGLRSRSSHGKARSAGGEMGVARSLGAEPFCAGACRRQPQSGFRGYTLAAVSAKPDRGPLSISPHPPMEKSMRTSKRIGVMTTVLWALAAAAVLLSACGAANNPIQTDIKALNTAKDASVRSQLMLIRTGIQSYIAVNGAAPAQATQAFIGQYVSPWPTNPFTNAPMTPGSAPGDYAYTPLGGPGFTLSAYLADGTTYSP
jgi:hypothetical protein